MTKIQNPEDKIVHDELILNLSQPNPFYEKQC